jgi:eukaryotic-like serine/threonine-protein kinase
VVAALVLVAVLLFAADNAERGTGGGGPVATPEPRQQDAQLVSFSLKQDSAEDFDPAGDDVEHDDEKTFAVDRDPNTVWSTETYRGPLNKAGVGLVIDAEPGVAAAALEVSTPTAGFKASVYGAQRELPDGAPPDGGWTRLASSRTVASTEQIELDTGDTRYRYYLLWITELGPGDSKAEVSELRLFRRQNR